MVLTYKLICIQFNQSCIINLNSNVNDSNDYLTKNYKYKTFSYIYNSLSN